MTVYAVFDSFSDGLCAHYATLREARESAISRASDNCEPVEVFAETVDPQLKGKARVIALLGGLGWLSCSRRVGTAYPNGQWEPAKEDANG